MKYIFFIVSYFAVCLSNAQPADVTLKYHHQFQLIDSLRNYIVKDLKLNIPENFYTAWSNEKDSMFIFLYVSKSNCIEAVDAPYKRWHNEDSAIIESNQLKAKGYQTLIYKTAGASDAEINPKLLSYPDEAIAFIILHEAVHNHIRSKKDQEQYPYIFEESLCDAMANLASEQFAIKTKTLDFEKVQKQKRIFERAYRFLNREEVVAKRISEKKQESLFKKCNLRIKKLVRHGNAFQKDRMLYNVNNAYFLRNEYYALHYFELKQMLKKGIGINEVIKYVLSLYAIASD